MLYGKLIHDYLDGTLESTEEDMLFAEMSANQEVRREFQLQTKLNSAIKKDMSLATTPVDAIQAVFTSLGFALPTNSQSSTPLPPAHTQVGFWTKFYPHILTSFLSGLVTAIMFLWLSPNELNTKIIMENMARFNTSPIQPLTSEITDRNAVKIVEIPGKTVSIPVIRSFEITDNQTKTKTDNSDMSSAISSKENTLDVTQGSSQVISRSTAIPKSPVEITTSTPNTIPLFKIMDNVNPTVTLPDELLGIIVEGHGITKVSSFPNLSDAPASLPFLSNMSTSVLYEISEHHAVGLAGGREVFHEDFTRDSYGQSFSYRQSPSLWWYGVAYRYSFGDIGIKGLHPFVQGFTGWAQNGPIGKATLGVRYTPEQRISFILGAEGSYLAYPVGVNYFTTQKIGLTYGMSVNL